MKAKESDTVVLRTDLPEHALAAGDVGAVVTAYTADAAEVEFVTASGKTRALVTLTNDQIRPIGSEDILLVSRPNVA